MMTSRRRRRSERDEGVTWIECLRIYTHPKQGSFIAENICARYSRRSTRFAFFASHSVAGKTFRPIQISSPLRIFLLHGKDKLFLLHRKMKMRLFSIRINSDITIVQCYFQLKEGGKSFLWINR